MSSSKVRIVINIQIKKLLLNVSKENETLSNLKSP